MNRMLTIYVTRPAKVGHVDTNYTLLHNRTYLSIEINYLHSVACIVKPISCLISAKIFKAIASIMTQKVIGDESLTK